MRLPSVRVIQVSLSSPLVSSAVQGTSANGYVVAERRAALSADTPGRIVEMNVREGSVVKKGDVVARLYADEYRAALRRSEADLESAQAALVGARARLDEARQDVERQRREVSASEANLTAA